MANENTPSKKSAAAKPAAKAAPAKAKPAPAKAKAPAQTAPSPKPSSEKAAPAKLAVAKPASVKAVPEAKTPKTTKPAAKPVPAKAASKPATRKPSAPRQITGDAPMAAAKKDAAQETFETVTTASNEAIKEGFEKSLSAINDFSAFQKDTVDAVISSATSTSKSIEELNAATLAFAKKSMEDGVAAAKTMAGAKSVQELIEIQADYTKSSLDAYLSEVNKASDLVSAMMKDSFKPINDRMVAAVEAMQSQR
jgi:phasin family protein